MCQLPVSAWSIQATGFFTGRYSPDDRDVPWLAPIVRTWFNDDNDDLAIRISPDMIRKGLTLIGSWHCNLNDFPKVMQVIQESPVIDLLISHVMPMSQIQEAFACSASHESAKIILEPWA